MKVTIDFETRSPVDIKAHGAYVYAAHPLTEIMCLAIAQDKEQSVIYVPDKFREKIESRNINFRLVSMKEALGIVTSADEVHAQNAAFEFAIWKAIGQRRLGWPALPLEKVHDIMAVLAYHALPMNLDQASMALNLDQKKDMIGHAVMLKLCKPRNPRKGEPAGLYWHEDPRDLETLINYCGRDVVVERMIGDRLGNLPAKERAVWLHDQRINLRGIRVDTENVRAIVETVKRQEAAQLAAFDRVTGAAVSGPRSYVAFRNWVNKETGLNLPNVDKTTTEDLLKKNGQLPPHVREALAIKSELSKSSVSKFTSMLNRKGGDDRVRGWAAYHAAATGRWAAWGLQLHNTPRDSYGPGDYEAVCELFRAGDIEALGLLWDSPYFAASRCVRGALVAGPGKEFVCADFNAIEGRALAFLAGEQWVVDGYRDGVDMYKFAAADIFGIQWDQVDKTQRQIGKTAELALGYYGGIGAFATFAKGYGVDLEMLPRLILPSATQDELEGMYGAKALASMYLKRNPGTMSMNAAVSCDIIKRRWRAARPQIVRLWNQIESAAVQAIESPGRVFQYNGIQYAVAGGFLKCRLPSGRLMHYYMPRLDQRENLDPIEGEYVSTKPEITFMGMKIAEGETTRAWGRIPTFGGKLVENCIQALCRDLLAEAMLRVEAAGYPVVLHVHDEIVSEKLKGKEYREWDEEEKCWRPKQFEKLMSVVPAWAAGMPIKAKGWIDNRYHK